MKLVEATPHSWIISCELNGKIKERNEDKTKNRLEKSILDVKNSWN